MSHAVEQWMESIEKRLGAIEKRLDIPLGDRASIPTMAPWGAPSSTDEKQQKTAAKSPAKAGNWLGIVAVICFVFAAGFIVKLSIESGWLTPARQIGIAVLFGFSLIGAGFALMKSDRGYVSLLPGAGIIILYMSAFAAHRYYSLVSYEMALALVGAVSGLCIWMYMQIKHDAYAITASVGAYLSPVLLALHTPVLFSLYYFLICSVAFAFISVWVQSRTLTVVSAYLAILMTAILGLGMRHDLAVAAILSVNFVVFSLGAYWYSAQNKAPLTPVEAWSFLPVLLAFYAAEYYFISRFAPNLAPWISLGFAAILIGLYESAKKRFPNNLASQSLVLSFTALVAFHSFYLELLPEAARPWLFVMIMGAIAFSPFTISKGERGSPYYIPVVAIMAVLGIEYISIIFHVLETRSVYWVLLAFAALGSVWSVIVYADDTPLDTKKHGNVLLSAAHILAIVGLYRLSTDVGSLAVSALWLLYACGVIGFAFVQKDEVMAKSALFVLGFAAGKALLYDAASAPTLVRIMCLLLTGAVLYGCGLLMRKITAWQQP